MDGQKVVDNWISTTFWHRIIGILSENRRRFDATSHWKNMINGLRERDFLHYAYIIISNGVMESYSFYRSVRDRWRPNPIYLDERKDFPMWLASLLPPLLPSRQCRHWGQWWVEALGTAFTSPRVLSRPGPAHTHSTVKFPRHLYTLVSITLGMTSLPC